MQTVNGDTCGRAEPARRSYLSYFAYFLACFAVFVGSPFALGEENPRTSATVDVDFNAGSGQLNHIANGFLHGLSPTKPNAGILSQISITSLRAAPFYISGGQVCYNGNPSYFKPADPRAVCSAARLGGTWERVKSLSPAPFLIANIAFYPDKVPGRKVYWPEDDNFVIWGGIVDQVVKTSQAWGYSGAYSTWNEPDRNFRGHGGWSAYKRSYFTAFKRIRAACANCSVVGPEISSYDFALLKDFLTFARRNRVLPQGLDWHELTDDPSSIKSHVDEIRAWMAQQGFQKIPIYITEYGTRPSYTHPGNAASFIAYLENSGADLAIRANWISPTRNLSGNLPGAVSLDGTRLTGVGQVYRNYSEMSGTKVAASTSAAANAKAMPALASRDDSKGAAWVMLGRGDGGSSTTDVIFALANIPVAIIRNGSVHAQVAVVPDPPGPAHLAAKFGSANPRIAMDADIPVTEGRAVLKVPVPAWGSAFIRLTRVPAVLGSASPRPMPF